MSKRWRKRWRIKIQKILLVFLVVFAIGAAIAYAFRYATRNMIEVRIQDFEELHQALTVKIADTEAARYDFSSDIRELNEEILDEMKEQGIDDKDVALQNSEISGRVGLLQRNLAYSNKLGEVISDLEEADRDVLLGKRAAEADLRITSVLSAEELDGLINRLGEVHKKYAPHLGELVIDESELELPPADEVLEKLLQEGRTRPSVTQSREKRRSASVAQPREERFRASEEETTRTRSGLVFFLGGLGLILIIIFSMSLMLIIICIIMMHKDFKAMRGS